MLRLEELLEDLCEERELLRAEAHAEVVARREGRLERHRDQAAVVPGRKAALAAAPGPGGRS